MYETEKVNIETLKKGDYVLGIDETLYLISSITLYDNGEVVFIVESNKGGPPAIDSRRKGFIVPKVLSKKEGALRIFGDSSEEAKE